MFDQKVYLFISVVEMGSFSSAAKENGITQSAVSQSIAKLEKEIGITLFDRNQYRPILTKAGESYYKAILKLIKKHEALINSLKSI